MIFDAHFHIIDPRFPLVANDGYLPEAYTCGMYREAAQALGITGGAVVSGIVPGVRPDVPRRRAAHARAGFRRRHAIAGHGDRPRDRGARPRGGARAPLQPSTGRLGRDSRTLDTFARRVHAVAGWHAELYVDARELATLHDTPGRAAPRSASTTSGSSREGFDNVLRLAERGVPRQGDGLRTRRLSTWRMRFATHFHGVNPESADVRHGPAPSTRAPVPFRACDIDLVREALGADADHALWLDAETSTEWRRPPITRIFDESNRALPIFRAGRCRNGADPGSTASARSRAAGSPGKLAPRRPTRVPRVSDAPAGDRVCGEYWLRRPAAKP